MNLNREQELWLMELGVQSLLETVPTWKNRQGSKGKVHKAAPPVVVEKKKKKGRKWSKAQRAKFTRSMQKVWAKRKAKPE
jgi:hypothetical protein